MEGPDYILPLRPATQRIKPLSQNPLPDESEFRETKPLSLLDDFEPRLTTVSELFDLTEPFLLSLAVRIHEFAFPLVLLVVVFAVAFRAAGLRVSAV
jgi:hypothetical protein